MLHVRLSSRLCALSVLLCMSFSFLSPIGDVNPPSKKSNYRNNRYYLERFLTSVDNGLVAPKERDTAKKIISNLYYDSQAFRCVIVEIARSLIELNELKINGARHSAIRELRGKIQKYFDLFYGVANKSKNSQIQKEVDYLVPLLKQKLDTSRVAPQGGTSSGSTQQVSPDMISSLYDKQEEVSQKPEVEDSIGWKFKAFRNLLILCGVVGGGILSFFAIKKLYQGAKNYFKRNPVEDFFKMWLKMSPEDQTKFLKKLAVGGGGSGGVDKKLIKSVTDEIPNVVNEIVKNTDENKVRIAAKQFGEGVTKELTRNLTDDQKDKWQKTTEVVLSDISNVAKLSVRVNKAIDTANKLAGEVKNKVKKMKDYVGGGVNNVTTWWNGGKSPGQQEQEEDFRSNQQDTNDELIKKPVINPKTIPQNSDSQIDKLNNTTENIPEIPIETKGNKIEDNQGDSGFEEITEEPNNEEKQTNNNEEKQTNNDFKNDVETPTENKDNSDGYVTWGKNKVKAVGSLLSNWWYGNPNSNTSSEV